MKSSLFSALLILFSASVLADASVDSKAADKTFLLTAPGTLTGAVKGGSNDHRANESSTGAAAGTLPDQLESSDVSAPRFPPQQQRMAPPQQYRYVEDNVRKFRQFGQTSGQNNPWFDENGRRYAPPSKPMTSHPITNPWQLGGMPSMMGQTGNRSSYETPYPSPYNSGAYMPDSRLYPDYPDGIYRDNNPALLRMPGQSGFLPGFDGNSFPLPFSPFGMF